MRESMATFEHDATNVDGGQEDGENDGGG